MDESNPRIDFLVSSDTNYEELIVELYIDGSFAFLINQDHGVANLVIETPPADSLETVVTRKMSIDDFRSALEIGLKQIRRLNSSEVR